MKKIGILYHPMVEETRAKALEIQEFLHSRGVACWACSSWEAGEAKKNLDGTDLIISVGGDGTMLRSAQVAVGEGIPITGVNYGRLGFMTEFNAEEVMDRLPGLLAGEGWIEERALLEAEPAGAGVFNALNDVVVTRGETVRVIHVEALIDGVHMATYKADGVILATATGSTGYALSAGGAILYPRCQDFLLAPIVPHLSMPYATLLPQSAEVTLRVSTVHRAILSIDGHINMALNHGDTVKVRKSNLKARFLRTREITYFHHNLEEKLKVKK
jgi:NAD+ kinase